MKEEGREVEVEQFVVHEYNSEEYYFETHKIMIRQAHGAVERLRQAHAKGEERRREIRQKTQKRFQEAHESRLRRTGRLPKKTPREVQEIVEVSQETATSPSGLYTIQNMNVLNLNGLEAVIVPTLDTDIDLESVTGITVQLRTITEPDDPLIATYNTIMNIDEVKFDESGEIVRGKPKIGPTTMTVDPISKSPFGLGDTVVTIKSVHSHSLEDGKVAINGEPLRVESLVWLFPDLRAEDFQPVAESDAE